MIDQALLTTDLRKLVEKDLLPSLRKRAAAESSIDQALRAVHRAAKEARRTGFAFEVWLDDYLTQVGVAWVLGCVFVRFMEDNGLVDAKDNFPRIAGPGPALRQAQVVIGEENGPTSASKGDPPEEIIRSPWCAAKSSPP
jgi:hypothetical protein